MDADELGRVHISSAGAAKVDGGQLPAESCNNCSDDGRDAVECC